MHRLLCSLCGTRRIAVGPKISSVLLSSPSGSARGVEQAPDGVVMQLGLYWIGKGAVFKGASA
jgi:hypothetical protein